MKGDIELKRLVVGTTLKIEDKFHVITSVNEYDQLLCTVLSLDEDNPTEYEFNFADAILADVKYEFVDDCTEYDPHDWALLSEEKREKANQRHEFVLKVRDFKEQLRQSGCKKLKPRLAEFCNVNGFSLQTYYTWEKRLQETNGAKIALVRKSRSDKGSIGRRIHPKMRELMDEVIDKVINTKLAPNLSKGYKVFRTLAERVNKDLPDSKKIKVPCEKTFWAYLCETKRIPELVRTTLNEAITQAELDELEVWYNNILSQTTRPLEWVLADHHQLDIKILHPISKELLGKPWLTVLFDCYSRSVLGFYLSMEYPSTNSIQLALLDAAFPKSDVYLKTYGCKNSWPMYGTPLNLSLDNAWAHYSHSLKDLAGQISNYGTHAIALVWRPPYKARRGALIERFFGILEDSLIHLMPGTTKSNPQKRGDYDSEKNACFFLDDLRKFITVFITDYYHQESKKELQGMSPQERWKHGVLTKLLGKVSYPIGSYADKLFGVLDPKTRSVTEHGISFKGLSFVNQTLCRYRKKDSSGRRPTFRIRYNPWDLSKISVFYEGRYLCDAECKQFRTESGGIRHYSIWEWNLIKELMKEKKYKNAGAIHDLYDEFRSLGDYRLQGQKLHEKLCSAISSEAKVNAKRNENIIEMKNKKNLSEDLSDDELEYFGS